MRENKQRGASLIGLSTVILLISGIVFVGMKVSPIYFEFFRVDVAMEKLAAAPDAGRLSPSKLKQALLKRLRIDDVDDIKRQHIVVKREPKVMLLTVTYEKRNEMLDSLDLVGKYQKTIEIKVQEQ